MLFSYACLTALQLAGGQSATAPMDSGLNVVSPKGSTSGAKRLSGDFSLYFHCDVKATSQISRPFNLSGGLTFVIQAGNCGPELC